MLPNFLVIGAMKSGTTTIYDDLCSLESVSMVTPKESWNLVDNSDPESIKAAYNNSDITKKNYTMLGELSTLYAFYPAYGNVAEKASSVFGDDLKIIYVCRQPVDRAISHIKHDTNTGRLKIGDTLDFECKKHERYISVSMYQKQLLLWLNYFSPDNILVISMERYMEDRRGGAECILAHLNIANVALEKLDLGSHKNPAGDMLSAGRGIRAVVNSKYYRLYVRNTVPISVRSIFKKYLTRNVKRTDLFINEKEIEFLLNGEWSQFIVMLKNRGIRSWID